MMSIGDDPPVAHSSVGVALLASSCDVGKAAEVRGSR